MNTGVIVGGAVVGTLLLGVVIYLAVKPSEPAPAPQQFAPYPPQPVIQQAPSDAVGIAQSVATITGTALQTFLGSRADRDRAEQARADREAARQDQHDLMVFCTANPNSGLCTSHASPESSRGPATSGA